MKATWERDDIGHVRAVCPPYTAGMNNDPRSLAGLAAWLRRKAAIGPVLLSPDAATLLATLAECRAVDIAEGRDQ